MVSLYVDGYGVYDANSFDCPVTCLDAPESSVQFAWDAPVSGRARLMRLSRIVGVSTLNSLLKIFGSPSQALLL